jgi:hypothetical protein
MPAAPARYLRLAFPADTKAEAMSVWEFGAYAPPPPLLGDFPSR